MRAHIRRRRPDDVEALVDVLARQQSTSGYPVEWPLPFPVEDFIVRDREEAAWIAELDGRPVGHISLRFLVDDPDGLARRWSQATGADVPTLVGVAALFVDVKNQGEGIGGALLDAAEGWAIAAGRVPVLDVARPDGRAVAVYARRGWHRVGEARPSWLPEDLPPVTLMALLPGGAEPS